MNDTYFRWMLNHTATTWWHDSAEATELATGLARGATGVTTNPILSAQALRADCGLWASEIEPVLARSLPAEQKAEALMRVTVTKASARLLPEFESSRGQAGFVCAQVNPIHAANREAMLGMAKRLHAWAPNIAVKLPATAAGLDVLEDCVAGGLSVTATVSFTVPQVVAVAERHRAGIERARARSITPGKCFAVIMIGRLDDFLREVAQDNRIAVGESDIRQAGLAVTKRAYAIYQERGYQAVLLVAALRGPYHLTELVGARLVMSIHPAYQEAFVTQDFPRQARIDEPVPADVVDRLRRIPEFVRSYEPDGMAV
ncbi:MAG: transaldolase family protein, partial [Candidatus Solibacter sp.]